MNRRLLVVLGAALLGLLPIAVVPAVASAQPARAAATAGPHTVTPLVEPSGCTASVSWVTQGSNHFYGQGNAQCDSGQYHVEATCKNVLFGLTYMLPGYTVAAPSTSTVVCNTGDTVQSLVTRTP